LRYQDEKLRIARAAVEHVVDGTAIGLTGGTTTTGVARALADRPGLTVVTNALNIASELAVRPNLKLLVTGGVARSESYELVGPIAEQSLAGLNLDIVFLGVDGIAPEPGLTTHHEIEAHTNRALIERARRVVVVADSSKIGRVAFARICELDRVDELITDSAADPRALATIADAGVGVTTV
jgi:DeoR family transcriptional regulator of aga operon